jgi:hypothetical protein
VGELDVALDSDPRAVYFRQAAYGVPIRMALISLLLAFERSGEFEKFEDGLRPSHHLVYDQPPEIGIRCTNSNCIVHDPMDGRYARNKFYLIDTAEPRLRCFYCERDIAEFVVAHRKNKTFESRPDAARILPKLAKDVVFFAGGEEAEAGGYAPKRARRAARS